MCDIPLPSPKSLLFIKSLLSDQAFKGTLSQLSENQYCEEGLCIGDAKLLAAIGSNLGLQAIPMILLFTSLIGILIGLFYYKNSNQKSFFKLSIPLAPSLSISYVLYLLINFQMSTNGKVI